MMVRASRTDSSTDAAVEIAALCGDASNEAAARCAARADRVIARLTRLIR